MDLKTIFVILLLASATALCIGLIIYLNKITKTIKEMGNDIKDLSYQIKPLIASTTNLSEKLNGLVEDAMEPVDVAKSIAIEVKDKIDKILDMEEKVRENIQRPVMDFTTNFSAVLNGINAFWNAYKRNH